MFHMKEDGRRREIPHNMKGLVLLAVLFLVYPKVTHLSLSDKHRIFVSLIGGAVAPFLVLLPGSYRLKFIIGSVANVLPPLLFFNTYAQAFLLGMIFTYLKTCSELYSMALCIRTRKKAVLVLNNLCASLIAVCAFFILHFLPALAPFVALNPIATVVVAIAGVAISARHVIRTPEEIMREGRGGARNNEVFEEMFHTLAYINGPVVEDERFHDEYRELIEKKFLEERPSVGLRTYVRVLAEQLNISFVYLAFQFALSLSSTLTLYRLFLGIMQLFSWYLTYMLTAASFSSGLFLIAALYLVNVTVDPTDVLLVLFLFLGYSFAPSSKAVYALTRADFALVRSLQFLLASLVFLGVSTLWGY